MPNKSQLNQSTSAETGSSADEYIVHLAILEALADGVDPFTGEDLSEDDLFRDPRVHGAMAAGMAALNKEAARLERRKKMPSKTGQPWTAEEDARLVEAYESGREIAALAEEHGRTRGAITSRLTKLGKMMP